jgi:hypothetical protein
MMKKAHLFFLFFIASTFVISCKPDKDSSSLSPEIYRQLDSVEQAMFAATSNGDSAAFRKLSASDYFTINADGASHNLEESIPTVPLFKGSSAVLSEQRQREFGDMVLRNGRAKIMMGGQQVAEILYTSGWVYRDGRWQFVHWQGTLTGMSLPPLQGMSVAPVQNNAIPETPTAMEK